MAETQAAVQRRLEPSTLDRRIERSAPDIGRFALLVLPLGLLLAVFRFYQLEEPSFFTLCCLVFGGFAISYWLPFRLKESFLILLSLTGAFILLTPVAACLVIGLGLAMFGVIRTGLAFRWKIAALIGFLAVFAWGRAVGTASIPRDFWPVFGSLFMFRMIVYLYDVKHASEPPRLKDFLSYFYLLPNYYFLLFPVVDYKTFRKSYFGRNINDVAQQGIWWIVRGATQLLLYRVIYQNQNSFSPPKVPVPAAVAIKILFCYLLYLRISGQFHIIVGMLHLFGYDLPETNRRYLLANSIVDYWRRINIYWKDFMVKIFYFPAYFKMRRGGEVRAQLVATMLVFVVTWFLHACQFFWLQGRFRVSVNDSLFWIILGTLVMANVWYDMKKRKRLPVSGVGPKIRNMLQIAATLTVISVLWSMWSANSLEEWLYFLKSGNI